MNFTLMAFATHKEARIAFDTDLYAGKKKLIQMMVEFPDGSRTLYRGFPDSTSAEHLCGMRFRCVHFGPHIKDEIRHQLSYLVRE